MSIRQATHAPSWYEENPKILSSQLDTWLSQVPASIQGNDTPVPGARLIIAPHAGYRYSGPAAAWAYKCLDLSKAKRVFLLGPNHQHYNLRGLALSTREYYATPLGNLKLDLDTMAELRGKYGIEELNKLERNEEGEIVYNEKREPKYVQVQRGFEALPKIHEDNEHSLEMHLPYIYKMMSRVFDSPEDFPPIIPIMVGATSAARERIYGKILAPYLRDPDNVFIVSSDFCHWGRNFSYYYYLPASSAAEDGYDLGHEAIDTPIHDSIRRLDEFGMDAVQAGNHRCFVEYLANTGNTICGRHPIGVVMVAVEFIRSNVGKDLEKVAKNPEKGEIFETFKDDDKDIQGIVGKEGEEAQIDPHYGKFNFVQYQRSELVVRKSQSSVSYASAYAVL